jgi:perosamine synthetase
MRQFFPVSMPTIGTKEIEYVTGAVSSGWVSSLGKYIEQFETEFARFCGVQYALTTSNGTVALHLALEALGIGKGDEVIVPDLTFIATANAVAYTGATPVFADIDLFNLCINGETIKEKITKKTKAIIPVHLYGHPADMVTINKIAKENNLLVIEDSAEALGASINGVKTGAWSDCATFSFYGNKNITTGEGGMITTNNRGLYEKCRRLRDHAMDPNKRYWHNEKGFNYRMTNLQAALGCAQLERIEELSEKRRQIFKWYNDGLKDIKEISLNRIYPWAQHAFWLVCMEIETFNEEIRDEFMTLLRKEGVDSRPYFYPISDMPMYNKVDTPNAHEVYVKGINLPTYFDLTEENVYFICTKIKETLRLLKR